MNWISNGNLVLIEDNLLLPILRKLIYSKSSATPNLISSISLEGYGPQPSRMRVTLASDLEFLNLRYMLDQSCFEFNYNQREREIVVVVVRNRMNAFIRFLSHYDLEVMELYAELSKDLSVDLNTFNYSTVKFSELYPSLPFSEKKRIGIKACEANNSALLCELASVEFKAILKQIGSKNPPSVVPLEELSVEEMFELSTNKFDLDKKFDIDKRICDLKEIFTLLSNYGVEIQEFHNLTNHKIEDIHTEAHARLLDLEMLLYNPAMEKKNLSGTAHRGHLEKILYHAFKSKDGALTDSFFKELSGIPMNRPSMFPEEQIPTNDASFLPKIADEFYKTNQELVATKTVLNQTKQELAATNRTLDETNQALDETKAALKKANNVIKSRLLFTSIFSKAKTQIREPSGVTRDLPVELTDERQRKKIKVENGGQNSLQDNGVSSLQDDAFNSCRL